MMAQEDITDLLLSDDMDESNRAIQALHGTFNREIVTHALIDAEKALQSALDIKKELDEKAFWFLKFLVPLATLLVGYFIINLNDLSVMLNAISETVNRVKIVIIAVSIIFIVFIPIFFFVLCLAMSRNYASLGRYPDTWLRKGVIDSDEESVYVTNLVFILRDMQEGLIVSKKSNEEKGKGIRCGIGFILLGVFIALFGLNVISLYQSFVSMVLN